MDKIIEYFVNEKCTTEAVANALSKSICKYSDIKNEFAHWIENRTFDIIEPIVIESYTAKDIYEIEPTLDVAGVYNFLVLLRDNPLKAKKYIENGFTRK